MTLNVVSREQLEALARLTPTDERQSHTQNGHKPGFDLGRWIVEAQIEIDGPEPWDKGRRWVFPVCPWNPDHTNRSAYILQFADGAIAAGCHHNGCHGKDWHALRDLIEPGWQERRRGTPDYHASDKKLAEVVLKKRKVAIAEGKYLDKQKLPRCTFTELAQHYPSWAQVNHRGYASTRSRVEHLRDTFGPMPLREITPMVIDAYVADRAAMRTPATVNREVQILHHMFVKALEWGKALENPVRHQKPLRVNNRRLRYLSQEEITRLLSTADDFLRPIVLTALHTGLRRGALLALTWQDIDLPQGVIRVPQTKNGERLELPMTETLRVTLQQLPRRLVSDYVFPGKTGQGLVDIRKRFHRALREAGIGGFVFHDWRHTFASHLVMAGVDLMTVKEFLGHKDIKMTLRYAHLAPDYKRSAISRLDTSMDTTNEKGATA